MSEQQYVPESAFNIAVDIYATKAQIAALSSELDEQYDAYVDQMKSFDRSDLLLAVHGLRALHGDGYSTRLEGAGFEATTVKAIEAKVRGRYNDGDGKWRGCWPLREEDPRPAPRTWVVYKLLAGDELLYIGSTGDFRTRLKAHERDKSFDFWHAAECASERHCRDLETALIDRYRPPLNRMIPTPRLELA